MRKGSEGCAILTMFVVGFTGRGGLQIGKYNEVGKNWVMLDKAAIAVPSEYLRSRDNTSSHNCKVKGHYIT